jgi:hypothetical protein
VSASTVTEEAIAELLHRYELGDFSDRVRVRLQQVFQLEEEEALIQLHKACRYLGVDGSRLEEFGRMD